MIPKLNLVETVKIPSYISQVDADTRVKKCHDKLDRLGPIREVFQKLAADPYTSTDRILKTYFSRREAEKFWLSDDPDIQAQQEAASEKYHRSLAEASPAASNDLPTKLTWLYVRMAIEPEDPEDQRHQAVEPDTPIQLKSNQGSRYWVPTDFSTLATAIWELLSVGNELSVAFTLIKHDPSTEGDKSCDATLSFATKEFPFFVKDFVWPDREKPKRVRGKVSNRHATECSWSVKRQGTVLPSGGFVALNAAFIAERSTAIQKPSPGQPQQESAPAATPRPQPVTPSSQRQQGILLTGSTTPGVQTVVVTPTELANAHSIVSTDSSFNVGGGENANTGDANTGDVNTEDTNTGDANTGDANTRDTNTGDANIRDTNTGDANTGDDNNGENVSNSEGNNPTDPATNGANPAGGNSSNQATDNGSNTPEANNSDTGGCGGTNAGSSLKLGGGYGKGNARRRCACPFCGIPTYANMTDYERRRHLLKHRQMFLNEARGTFEGRDEEGRERWWFPADVDSDGPGNSLTEDPFSEKCQYFHSCGMVVHLATEAQLRQHFIQCHPDPSVHLPDQVAMGTSEGPEDCTGQNEPKPTQNGAKKSARLQAKADASAAAGDTPSGSGGSKTQAKRKPAKVKVTNASQDQASTNDPEPDTPPRESSRKIKAGDTCSRCLRTMPNKKANPKDPSIENQMREHSSKNRSCRIPPVRGNTVGGLPNTSGWIPESLLKAYIGQTKKRVGIRELRKQFKDKFPSYAATIWPADNSDAQGPKTSLWSRDSNHESREHETWGLPWPPPTSEEAAGSNSNSDGNGGNDDNDGGENGGQDQGDVAGASASEQPEDTGEPTGDGNDNGGPSGGDDNGAAAGGSGGDDGNTGKGTPKQNKRKRPKDPSYRPAGDEPEDDEEEDNEEDDEDEENGKKKTPKRRKTPDPTYKPPRRDDDDDDDDAAPGGGNPPPAAPARPRKKLPTRRPTPGSKPAPPSTSNRPTSTGWATTPAATQLPRPSVSGEPGQTAKTARDKDNTENTPTTTQGAATGGPHPESYRPSTAILAHLIRRLRKPWPPNLPPVYPDPAAEEFQEEVESQEEPPRKKAKTATKKTIKKATKATSKTTAGTKRKAADSAPPQEGQEGEEEEPPKKKGKTTAKKPTAEKPATKTTKAKPATVKGTNARPAAAKQIIPASDELGPLHKGRYEPTGTTVVGGRSLRKRK